MNVQVIQGDIAAQRADALVNAANTSLAMGSGVAGALRRVAGEELNKAAMAQGPIDLGSVAVTDAFDLDADYVIHAAAMPHDGDRKATESSIRNATKNALTSADELGCASVILPAIGCGVAGFSLDTGVRLIAEEIKNFEGESLEDIQLIGYSDEEYETIQAVIAEVLHD